MSVKNRLREFLIRRQSRQYERRLAELSQTHDQWQRKREFAFGLVEGCEVRYFGASRSGEDGEGSRSGEPPAIFCVLYSDIERFIESGELLTCGDSEIVMFACKEGRLSGSAAPLVWQWFLEHPTGKLVYGDEDVLTAEGIYEDPYFKPDWSPDTYASCFYIGSVFAVRGSVLKNALLHGDRQDLSPAQRKLQGKLLGGLADALFLKLAVAVGGFRRRRAEDPEEFPVGHISEILFHREAGRDLFGGRPYPEAPAVASAEFLLPMYSASEEGPGGLVTIVIPTKDHPDILSECLRSIRDTCDGTCPFEILIVDNGSTGYNKILIASLVSRMEGKVEGLRSIRYIHRPMPFNFSRMCNLGASMAEGDLLLFLNDDITAVTPGWLRELAFFARRPHVGAVGAKLLYPPQEARGEDPMALSAPEANNRIQHAGVTNVRLGPMHKLQTLTDDVPHYFGFNRGIHDLLAVTGACLMVGREKFREAGGLPEDMAVAFNDVDLCYTLFEHGYYNVQCNHVVLYHHESLSRGLDTLDPAKLARLAEEHRTLMGRHGQLYDVDPFYSVHLVEDEHITEIEPLYEVSGPQEIPVGNLSRHERGLAGIPVDPVLRLGVEYADTLEYWLTGTRGEARDGYYIKGYSFVIGADNACYDRRLLLRRLSLAQTVDGRGTAYVPETEVYSLPANDWYRPDIRAKLSGQIHVDLTGYRVRIGREDLPEGLYQLGMLAIDRTSRQRLVNWVENRIRIGAG